MHYAARSVDRDMLKLLLEPFDKAEKARLVNQPDNSGLTPIYLSLQK